MERETVDNYFVGGARKIGEPAKSHMAIHLIHKRMFNRYSNYGYKQSLQNLALDISHGNSLVSQMRNIGLNGHLSVVPIHYKRKGCFKYSPTSNDLKGVFLVKIY